MSQEEGIRMCWHKWGKWELLELKTYSMDYRYNKSSIMHKQRRQCLRCGKYQ